MILSSRVSPMADVMRMGMGNAPCQSPFDCIEAKPITKAASLLWQSNAGCKAGTQDT